MSTLVCLPLLAPLLLVGNGLLGLYRPDGGPRIGIKDLRAQFAIAAEEAGLPQPVIVYGMGHNGEAMTRR